MERLLAPPGVRGKIRDGRCPPAQPFQRLDRCVYKPQRWNVCDSFPVILSDVNELIFRLYFVNTPEQHSGPTGDIPLTFRKEFTRFEDRAREEREPL